jgi:hypothetical protein
MNEEEWDQARHFQFGYLQIIVDLRMQYVLEHSNYNINLELISEANPVVGKSE